MPAIVVVLLLLPLVTAVGIVAASRSRRFGHLVQALVLSGVTGALLTAFFAFSLSTVPIAPYELSEGAWLPILGQLLLAMYVGFGLGVAIAAVIAVPFAYLRGRNRTA